MNEVNRTLYIPLCGKAAVSRKGILLADPKAEAIWAKEGFPLHGKAKSKWLAYYMGMRAAVFDRWLAERLAAAPDAVVLHIGCGLDARVERVRAAQTWYDVDFPAVIDERRRYFDETPRYHMLGADARDPAWLEAVPSGGDAVVVMEGVAMYMDRPALVGLLAALTKHFATVSLLTDVYTVFAAKASKYKNPINEVGVTQLYGVDDAAELTADTGLRFVGEHTFTPPELVDQLQGFERRFFRFMFTGRFAAKIYRLYEYTSKQ